MELDRDISRRHDQSRRGYRDERMDDAEDGGNRERMRNSGRKRSKDRTREYDDVTELENRDKERRNEREKEDLDRDRSERRRRDRELERDKGRGQRMEREKDRNKEHDKRRSLERDHVELDKELERERGTEKDRERGRERGKDRDRAKDGQREREKEREKEKEKRRDKQEKEANRERYKDKDKEKNRETSEDKLSSRDGEIDGDEDKELERADIPKFADAGDVNISKRDGAKNDLKKINDRLDDTLHPSSLKIKERITKMKEERLKNKNDGASEISSWVNKSRSLEDKRKVEMEKASHRLRILDEQDVINEESDDDQLSAQSAKGLAGVKVLHGLDKVLEGGSVVLTLKDQTILEAGDINEEVDMLENVEIGEQKQRNEAYRAAKKSGKYDDKFNENAYSQRTMLPQYDDPKDEEGITLDEGGRFGGEAEKQLQELRRKILGDGSARKSFDDLTTSGKITSDYYTSEEMLQFKKPKKKKSLRKREKLDLDVLEAEARSAGLGAGDLGSRKDGKRQSAKEERDKTEAETRNDAYQSAYAKAEEASRALRLEQTLTVKSEKEDEPIFGEDYEDLQKSLEQARKLALRKKDETAISGPQAVAMQVLAGNVPATANNSLSEPQENKVVITEVKEFVVGLQFNDEIYKAESEDVFMDDAINQPMDIEKEDESSSWAEVNQTVKDDLSSTSELKEEIVPDETIHEVTVGKGLSGALKLLKDRGTLKETINWGGRNMDKKKSKLVGIHENDGPKEINIERTDEFGRIMTPKEAFRVISHKFHGKGPGKTKQEKRMKQYEDELKLKQMKASDTPSESMERIRDAQARLHTPYLVLSGHVKPGQTSDPRSGFATVEKDCPGSLTPMLGDRKVEHFLGIKRKDNSGSMGPPPLPPKKPRN